MTRLLIFFIVHYYFFWCQSWMVVSSTNSMRRTCCGWIHRSLRRHPMDSLSGVGFEKHRFSTTMRSTSWSSSTMTLLHQSLDGDDYDETTFQHHHNNNVSHGLPVNENHQLSTLTKSLDHQRRVILTSVWTFLSSLILLMGSQQPPIMANAVVATATTTTAPTTTTTTTTATTIVENDTIGFDKNPLSSSLSQQQDFNEITSSSLSSSLSRNNNNVIMCPEDSEARRIEIFERTASSVVFIDTFTEQRDIFSTNVMEVPLGSGSGFVWDNQGHIVTNYHVVRNANAAQVAILTTKNPTDSSRQRKSFSLSSQQNNNQNQNNNNLSINPFASINGLSTPQQQQQRQQQTLLPNAKRAVYNAKVVGVDPNKDIAVLQVDAPRDELFPIAVGTSTGLRVGQQSLAIGNPFGLDHTLTAGIISGIGREVKSPTGRPISNVIQTDAAINPGNSGGPLLDSQGRLIGMNTAIYSPSGGSAGIGFAIPVDTVKYIVETLIRDGQVVRPLLGISLLESKQAQALGINRGVLVLEVPKESPAYKAGMRGTIRRPETGLIELGDIIVKVGNVDITTEADLFKAVESYKPGDQVKVTVVRVEPFSSSSSRTNDRDELLQQDPQPLNMKELVLTIRLIASSDFKLDSKFSDR